DRNRSQLVGVAWRVRPRLEAASAGVSLDGAGRDLRRPRDRGQLVGAGPDGRADAPGRDGGRRRPRIHLSPADRRRGDGVSRLGPAATGRERLKTLAGGPAAERPCGRTCVLTTIGPETQASSAAPRYNKI